MLDKGTIFIISVVTFIAICMVAIFSFSKTHQAEIFTFTIQKPYFEVTGRNISRVEVWAIPTGTGIKVEDQVLLAVMERVSDKPQQIWHASIPTEPLLVTTIYIKAFDANNHVVSQKGLPFTGATELYDALWNVSRPLP